MCRLFGFRSVIPSQMHRSLVQADNALCTLSRQHPDGWGVAYYIDGSPHLTRATATALDDHLFHRLSGVVSSETVVAHVRRATQGAVSVLNTHPFQHGRWVFAHNGDIPEFPKFRAALLEQISPRLRRFILGDTDSEIVFFLFLTELLRTAPLPAPRRIDEAMRAMAAAVGAVRAVCDVDGRPPAVLTLVATDGVTLVATRGGRELHWSSYKRRCADREVCTYLAAHCEAPTLTGQINHLILSSEPLGGENIWLPLADGDLIGVDERMRLTQGKMDSAGGVAIDRTFDTQPPRPSMQVAQGVSEATKSI